jgi:hypothetical protein
MRTPLHLHLHLRHQPRPPTNTLLVTGLTFAFTCRATQVHKMRQLEHRNVIKFLGLFQGDKDVIPRTYLMEKYV